MSGTLSSRSGYQPSLDGQGQSQGRTALQITALAVQVWLFQIPSLRKRLASALGPAPHGVLCDFRRPASTRAMMESAKPSGQSEMRPGNNDTGGEPYLVMPP